MAKGNYNVGVNFEANVDDLVLGLTEARRKINTLNKEFKSSTSEMDNWKNREDGLTEKLAHLNAVLKVQEAALKGLNAEYEKNKEQYGENNIATEKARNKMLDMKAAIGKTNKEISKYTAALTELKNPTEEVVDASKEFKDSLANMDASIEEANAEFRLASSRMDDWEDSTEGVQAKLKQLNSVLESQTQKLSAIESEYQRVSREQGDNSTEAKELRTQFLNQQRAVEGTKREIAQYNVRLEDVSKKSRKTGKDTDKFGKSMKGLKKDTDKASGGFTVMKGVLSQLISRTLVSAMQSIMSAIQSSRELRKEIGMLNATATTLGASFDNAKKNLIEVASITDDTGAAVEGLNNLMTAGFDGKALDDITDMLVGASIKWKDTLKFEGLSDGLQETLATGKAIGPFAEMLERAGVNLDVFNAGLEASYDPAKKQQYILDTLAKLGLTDVKDEYEKINGSLMENNKAIANQQLAYAELNKVIEPLDTALRNFGTGIITKITPAMERLSETLQKLLSGDIKGALGDVNAFVERLRTTVWDAITDFAKELPSKISEMSEEIVGIVGNMLTASATLKFDLAGAMIQGFNSLLDALPNMLDSIVEGIDKFVPQVLDAVVGLSDLIAEVSPEILRKTVSIIPRLIGQVSKIIRDNLPTIIESLKSAVDNIIELLPRIMASIQEAIPAIVESLADLLVENVPVIMDAITQIVLKIVDAMPMLFDMIVVQLPHLIRIIVKALIDAFPQILEAISTIFWKIIEALPMLMSGLTDNIPSLISTVIDAFMVTMKDFNSIGGSMIQAIIEGFIGTLGSMIKGLGAFVDEVVKSLKSLFGIGDGGFRNSQLYKIGEAIIKGMVEGVKSVMSNMFDTFIKLGDGIIEKVKGLPGKLGEIGGQLLTGMWEGIKDKLNWLKNKIKGIGESIVGWFKDIFGIHSPSKLMEDEVGKMLGLGIGEGLMDSTGSVLKDVDAFAKKLRNGISGEISAIQGGLTLNPSAFGGIGGNTSNVNNFTQNIYAPKQPSRRELYRDTRNLLALKGGN